MKSLARFRLTVACFGLLSVAAIPTARADFKCDRQYLTRVDATACAKAAEGAPLLRQYVSRTQMIYGLQMADYIRFEEDAPKVPFTRTSQGDTQHSLAGRAPPSR